MPEVFESPAVLAVIVLIIIAIKLRKTKSKSNAALSARAKPDSKKMTEMKVRAEMKDLGGKVHAPGHTHDRLDADCYSPSESESEHYKKQLDSFLKAGLIEKSEYRELARRYAAQTSSEKKYNR